MTPEPSPFQLREPTAVESLLPGWWLPPILITAAILIALTIIAILLIRYKNRPRPINLGKIREESRLKAVAGLESARSTATTPRDAAIRASLLLRSYLATAADDPALFETHEEFIARRDSLAILDEQARAAAATGFAHLATIKYTAHPPDDTASQVIEAARTLLDELHRGFSAT